MRILDRGQTTLRVLLLALPVASAGSAQPPAPADCDQSLLQQIAVQGINPAWTGEKMYSSPLIPSIGFATADMAAAIDPTVANYMNLYGIPGGSVAITYNGALIFAKSYGYIDVANAAFAEPDSRFRMASVSKAITGMGIMKLVHDGHLTLDTQPFPFAGVKQIIAGTPGNYYYAGPSNSQNPNYNSQLSQITVNDLLHHAGGWNRDNGPDLESYDTLQPLVTFLSQATHTPSGPPDCTTLMSFVESQPLQVAPPTKETHYSNIGFCALSEVIRETSGLSYLDYMTTNVFSPLGMRDTALGATPEFRRLDRESVYYDFNDPPLPSLFPPYGVTPAPYSGIGSLEAEAGAGGIVSSAIDIALFAGAIASGKLPNLAGPGSAGSASCAGPDPAASCGWSQNYYLDSSALPNYECVTVDSIPPYVASDSCASRGIPRAEAASHFPFGSGWDQAVPNVVADPLLSYNNFNFVKDGGYQGTVSSLATTGDGYGFGAVFNQNDNTIPSPAALLFWPNCSTPPPLPLPASSSDNCALQAAYNHQSSAPWNVNFSPQFARVYSAWMTGPVFETYLAAQQKSGRYPSRLEGRATGTGSATVLEYRGRFGTQASGATPQYQYGQSCAEVLSAAQSATANTPLVSLQRFKDSGGAYVYQAVWSAPIP
jgi:CubicO group peptidase (beta-lactamase class C family)